VFVIVFPGYAGLEMFSDDSLHSAVYVPKLQTPISSLNVVGARGRLDDDFSGPVLFNKRSKFLDMHP
jgi:hypothetical protein